MESSETLTVLRGTEALKEIGKFLISEANDTPGWFVWSLGTNPLTGEYEAVGLAGPFTSKGEAHAWARKLSLPPAQPKVAAEQLNSRP